MLSLFYLSSDGNLNLFTVLRMHFPKRLLVGLSFSILIAKYVIKAIVSILPAPIFQVDGSPGKAQKCL